MIGMSHARANSILPVPPLGAIFVVAATAAHSVCSGREAGPGSEAWEKNT